MKEDDQANEFLQDYRLNAQVAVLAKSVIAFGDLPSRRVEAMARRGVRRVLASDETTTTPRMNVEQARRTSRHARSDSGHLRSCSPPMWADCSADYRWNAYDSFTKNCRPLGRNLCRSSSDSARSSPYPANITDCQLILYANRADPENLPDRASTRDRKSDGSCLVDSYCAMTRANIRDVNV